MALKTLIVGSGPAGYTAAIYASRSSLNPVLYEGMQPGGQLTQTTEVENFPGYPEGTTGQELMDDLRKQAERLGTDIRFGMVTKVEFSKDGSTPHKVTTDDGTVLEAHTVIISTGASAKYLGLDDEKKYAGQGVSACATCDGFFYRKKVTAVVGGGDTACEDALYLSGLCQKVYLVVRKDYLRASDIMQQRVKSAENIEILFKHNVTGLYGENGVEGMHVVEGKDTPEEKHYDVNIDGLFLAIGHAPVTDFVKAGIKTDNQGYIVTDGKTQEVYDQEGNVIPGVFAAGDVCDPTYRQAVVAAGTVCKAALDAEKYIQSL